MPTPIANPAFTDPAYKNVLHLKPLSHHIGFALTSVGTSLQQKAKPQRWHGKALIHMTKALLVSGYILNIVIASIETIAALVFSIPLLALQAATKGKINFLHQFSLKACAYTINAFLIAGTHIICLKRGFFSKHHTINAIANHTLHGTAAIFSQVIGLGFDHMAGRNHVSENQLPPSLIRGIRILIELSPRLIRDATRGISRDFNVTNNQEKNINLQAFVETNPDYADILNRFDFENLDNSQYRGSLLRLFGNFLVYSGILNQLPGTKGIVLDVFGINDNEINQIYQNDLKQLIKTTFLELHDNEELIKLFSSQKEVDDGRNELLTYSAFLQMAYFTQLKEIEKEISCPEVFGGLDLHHYNNRKHLLITARSHLNELTDQEKHVLIKKLLLRGEFDFQGIQENRIKILQNLFIEISTLALDFYKGSLLIQKTVDLSLLNQGAINQTIGEINLLKTACEEAQQEIISRQKSN